MTTAYKVLGQVAPAATTLTTLYTAPALTSAVVSTLSICNQGVSTTYRVAVRPAGASIVASHYVVYNAAVNANDTVMLTLGIALSTTDVVSVYSATATMSFNLFGAEITT